MFKGHLMHVNQIAAISRKTTVNNCTIPKPTHSYESVFTCWKEIKLSKFDTPVYGKKFGIDKDGHYHLLEITEPEWEHKKYPQPKQLQKKYKKKYYCKGSKTICKIVEHPSDYDMYPKHEPVRMNQIEYCEKLVEHKLAKWERKNPKPMDMFVEDVEKWNQLKEAAKERIRDFVVSMYDKLPLIGRFKVPTVTAKYMEEKVADIKDINGDGHRVNEMPANSPLLKKAKKITNETKAKRKNLVATNLKDHKRKKGRIILPDSELQKAA